MCDVAAVDLGATSGRVIVGNFSAEGLSLTEVYRFPNAFRQLGKHAYWDLGGLFDHIKAGLLEAKKAFPNLASCGIDTWGVDYVMLDDAGRLVFPAHAYRDQRTEPLLAKLVAAGDDAQLYEWTGIPGINYNTGLQLHESLQTYPQLRDLCDCVLHLPDYFNFLLTGKRLNEVSICSTGQLLPVSGEGFSHRALKYFGILEYWFSGPTKAGRRLGPVQEVEELETLEVVLVPGHDTSCAFEAIPRIGSDLFVSAGTWLLAGGLTRQPATGAAAFKYGVSNERAGDGAPRPNKILIGLWLLEQLLPAFAERPESAADWDALIAAASEHPASETLLDSEDRVAFFNPPNMKAAIDGQLAALGVSPPEDLAGYTRLICDSLGQSVGTAVGKMGELTGETFDNLVFVGGGSRNGLLCQRAADLSGLPVTSYALEGTAVGNIGYQLLALGEVESLDDFREVVRKGAAAQTFQPR